ncbi:MAG: 30S ribosomal protein S7 [Candidatus Woesearchaeota archaeon]
MSEIKAFGKWSTEGIKIEDKGLVNYINLEPRLIPKTGARYAGKRFYKSKIFIVERLINKIMVTGHKGKKHKITSYKQTGKSHTAYGIVEQAFEIIEKETKENPIKVFVKAIENAAPREEVVSIEYGGARYPKAVECSPQRRIDLALRYFTQGAYASSFNKKISYAEALANEIINAYYMSKNSNAISKKLDLERQADSAR